MSFDKHLSLEEARRAGKLERFAKEHPMETDAKRFAGVLSAMAAGTKKSDPGTSGPDASADFNGTRSRRGTSQDA
jgi:hypothetical protein